MVEQWKRPSRLGEPGHHVLVSPDDGTVRWLTVTLHVLRAGEQLRGETGEHEYVLDVLAGTVQVLREGQPWQTVTRPSFFQHGPVLICIPPASRYAVMAETPATLLAVHAPAPTGGDWAVVLPHDAPARDVGRDSWQRTVWPGTSTLAVTQRLLVGETLNPPGGWSSYPPHKHDTVNPPRELPYEEVYFFRFDPPGGFGLQRIYGQHPDGTPFDVAFTVEDGDAIVIPRGYHPVVAAPGYAMGYVWALCGEGKQYGAWTEDPAHQWVGQTTRETEAAHRER